LGWRVGRVGGVDRLGVGGMAGWRVGRVDGWVGGIGGISGPGWNGGNDRFINVVRYRSLS